MNDENYETNFDELLKTGYTSFLFTGSITTVGILLLLSIYIAKPKLRVHPNGILFNLFIVLFLNSFKYLLNGIGFWVSGKDVLKTAFNNYAFALIPNYCWLESIGSYYLYMLFFGWNIAWILDLRESFRNPMHTTYSFLGFYSISIHILSAFLTIILLAIYLITSQALGISQNLTCNVSRDYHILFVTPFQIIYLLFSYFGIIRNPRVQIFALFDKRSSIKLKQFLLLQKAYFLIFMAFTILDFTNIVVFYSFHTFGIVGFIRFLFINIYSVSYPIQNISLTIPHLLKVISLLKSNPKKGNEKLISSTSNNLEIDKNQIDSHIRNDITKLLLRGIRKSLSFYWAYNKEAIISSNEQGKLCSWITKLFRRNSVSPKNSEDRNRIELSRQAYKKIKIINKNQIVEASKKVHIFLIPIENDNEEGDCDNAIDSKFESISAERTVLKTYAPQLFSNLRKLHNIKNEEILNDFSNSNLINNQIQTILQDGKGGSFFVIPKGGKYMIKSITREELTVLMNILPDFYSFFAESEDTLIIPIYGCFSLKISVENLIAPMYFILMKNINPKILFPIGSSSRILCFDLKGSISGRKTLQNPKVLINQPINCNSKFKTLKDEDFLLSYENLNLGKNISLSIKGIIQKDFGFFEQKNLIDYSLLLFIVETPITKFDEKEVKSHNAPKRKETINSFDELDDPQFDVPNYCELYYKLVNYLERPILYGEIKEKSQILIIQISQKEDVENITNCLSGAPIQEAFRPTEYKIISPVRRKTMIADHIEITKSIQTSKYRAKPLFDEISHNKFVINFERIESFLNFIDYKFNNLKIINNDIALNDNGIILVEDNNKEFKNVLIKESKSQSDASPDKWSMVDFNEAVNDNFKDNGCIKNFESNYIFQLIYDPKRGGLVKRIITFGIIDYLTHFGFRKKIERFLKTRCQDNPSVADPTFYKKRFTNFLSSIFN